MANDGNNQGSDADNADRAREDLKRQAEKGIENAIKGDQPKGSDDHPEQDAAEGSREVIERDLERQVGGGGPDENERPNKDDPRSSEGAEAIEPSPGDRNA